jgi:uncharacterized protein (DUF427 family)
MKTVEHRITIHPYRGHVSVRRGSTLIAETDRALELLETSHAPVLYIPLADVDRERLRASDHHTHCPYKGDASYYDLVAGPDDDRANAVWYYPEPYSDVDAIRGHVAFYADRVSITAEPSSEE